MTKISLSTLFTGRIDYAAFTAQASFRGNELQAFPSDRLEPNKDCFVSNPWHKQFKNKAEIERLAKSSPRIMALLKEYNIPLKVNLDALEKLEKGHLKDTRILAAKIASNLKEYNINVKDIQQAAMLHDFGKVLIPKEILDKEGALTAVEREIMELHSEFGYELLKQCGVKEEVLKLIKYHHQKPDGSGYPSADKDFEFNVNCMIIQAADKFSALTEDRCYRKACSKEEALEIIKKNVEEGTISQEVFEALKKSL